MAWWFANKYPDRVEKLAILNAPHHAAFGRALHVNWDQRFRSSYMLFFQLPYLPEMICRLFNWVPPLILWGKQDFALHPSLAQMSADQCDCARLIMLDSATHWIHHEEPETVNRFLIEFWQSRICRKF